MYPEKKPFVNYLQFFQFRTPLCCTIVCVHLFNVEGKDVAKLAAEQWAGQERCLLHCVHRAVLLTARAHAAGKTPNAIPALAIGSCSVITKENLSHH